MNSKKRSYSGDGVVVTYDATRCIHAAECVHGLPEVFDPDRKPWIQLEGADAGAVVQVVMRCPTGALQFARIDGGDEEAGPSPATVTAEHNGPLYLRGQFVIKDQDGTVVLEDTRIALCRCGASRHKPFCDNSHEKARFRTE